ncbi:MAG: UDP-N-acetylglucosamine--N-acetylmuramyl-(pentapeptide) pyrophosphoryl-undecaprenol N-acetylglucosamine transferase [Candidatus Paceibacteria bacterium]
MKILFVGGGTGGHFYPLIAVAEEIRALQPQAELYYIGPEAYNAGDLETLSITYVYCPAGKVRRYFSIQNFIDFFHTITGVFVAWYKLFIIYPDVIFSKGSFTSVPILLMARFYRIPVVIHESDSKPGRANMLARKFARYIGIAYADVASYFPEGKTARVGIPIRRVLRQQSANPFTELGIPNDRPLIYVTGGSSGAERINALILDSLSTLLPQYRIFHQTGPQHEATIIQSAQALLLNTPDLLQYYYVRGTMPGEMVRALLQASNIVISRAGSTTLFEIALHGKPSIVIPIPEDISHDQRTNAYSYARSGAGSVIEEHNLTKHLLQAEIQSIMTEPGKYQKMSESARTFAAPEAAREIADVLISIAFEHGT